MDRATLHLVYSSDTPPKTYITPLTRTAAWRKRGEGNSNSSIYLDDLYALQLLTQEWFKIHTGNVGPSPHGRIDHAMASDETRVFVFGGFSQGVPSDESSLFHGFETKDIKYPEPERNAAKPNENA